LTDQLTCSVKLIASEKINALPVNAKAIRNCTTKDVLLSRVLRFTLDGWPNDVSIKEPALQPFFARRNEMTIEQGVLLWGIRVVVPLALHPKVLAELHLSHMEIVKMKALARQFVWWPAIHEDIEKLCKTCDHSATIAQILLKHRSIPGPTQRSHGNAFMLTCQAHFSIRCGWY